MIESISEVVALNLSAICELAIDTTSDVDSIESLIDILSAKNLTVCSKIDVINVAVESSFAPNGILLKKVGIKTNASSSYSVNFEAWESPTEPVPLTIETVATSTSTEAEDEISDAAKSGTLKSRTKNERSRIVFFLNIQNTSGAVLIELFIIQIG